ncbi:uncharacterized protein EI97DRAFT_267326 [Westerdykella ornata]|uniref:Uncharacterized protein n=1 Tax=Westerdykella ornata TaxID=318751 RepID=A0A6A6J771_WESOR|nr:uncharacterized protein EI97DRAFT_267326 [Westerdykella ornata]KAF2271486.1 hypothetical protein EI97DRAFT_267326 [Westerdykella ornata]
MSRQPSTLTPRPFFPICLMKHVSVSFHVCNWCNGCSPMRHQGAVRCRGSLVLLSDRPGADFSSCCHSLKIFPFYISLPIFPFLPLFAFCFFWCAVIVPGPLPLSPCLISSSPPLPK